LRVVLSAKLLNPFISRLFNLTVFFLNQPQRWFGQARKYIGSPIKKW
jgi:hypothetical protein